MGNDADESVDALMQHLGDAKELDDLADRETQRTRTASTVRATIQRDPTATVLASNHETRLAELVDNEAITHRSSKAWKSAAAGVEAHGYLPIYYRLDGEVTHTGYITELALNPDEKTDSVASLVEHISDTDDYADYFELLDTTTFLVTGGRALAEPFPQSELRKLSDGTPIAENYSRQPAYVYQRDGDFTTPP